MLSTLNQVVFQYLLSWQCHGSFPCFIYQDDMPSESYVRHQTKNQPKLTNNKNAKFGYQPTKKEKKKKKKIVLRLDMKF